jgi:5-amino-6-(D-ribitylamino)uracil---L-tyrosine 4-hydroxyphenyl transferase
LINESISTSAGSQYGQLLRPKDMRKLISSIGKVPAQRTSNYKIIKEFETKEEIEYESNLDRIDPSVFGSYKELITLNKYKYKNK